MGTKLDREGLGRLIRARRNAIGLSLRAAASRTLADPNGKPVVSFSSWAQVETGELNTTLDVLDTMGEVLNARWDVSLVPDGPRMDQPRRELLERLQAIIDQMQDRDVRRLLNEMPLYERELGIQGHKTA